VLTVSLGRVDDGWKSGWSVLVSVRHRRPLGRAGREKIDGIVFRASVEIICSRLIQKDERASGHSLPAVSSPVSLWCARARGPITAGLRLVLRESLCGVRREWRMMESGEGVRFLLDSERFFSHCPLIVSVPLDSAVDWPGGRVKPCVYCPLRGLVRQQVIQSISGVEFRQC